MKYVSYLIAFLFLTLIKAQNIPANDQILVDFEAYSTLPREVVFVHLNKSVFIKGEGVGFKAYVLDKGSKRRSIETRNLYCTIYDSLDQVVKKQLIKIDKGIGSGLIRLDSAFTTGNYRFKAYTNWMRNFSEPNHFEQGITIIDPEKTEKVTPKIKDLQVDAQFLPESGHALIGVSANYGVVIKDENGFGYPFVEGQVEDSSGKIVTTFELNPFGIGRFALIPEQGEGYFARFSINNTEFKSPVGYIEQQGVTCTLQDLRDRIGLVLNAKFNVETQKKQNFTLSIHNGDSIKAIDISFRDEAEVAKIFPKEDLFPGINVFTLFDSTGNPILERLYFNSKDMVVRGVTPPKHSFKNDSVQVDFSVEGIDPKYWNSLSVSVLPDNTTSDKGHHNLASYSLIAPYIRGAVEHAAYYFRDQTPRKAYELDNLLITQGWSSYQWNTVRNKTPKYLFDFEKGISYKVILNKKESNEYYVSSSTFSDQMYYTLEENQRFFTKDQFFPVDDEKLRIAEIARTGTWFQPKVFVQFKPSAIPLLKNNRVSVLDNRESVILKQVDSKHAFEGFYEVEMLDEVMLLEQSKNKRIEKLKNRTVGRVDVFQENDPRRNLLLSTYLSSQGYAVEESFGTLSVTARNPQFPNNATPAIFLNGVLLNDFNILYRYFMDKVDYIEINKSGIGEGPRGSAGVIKIVTDPSKIRRTLNDPSLVEYDVPLTFSVDKRFYNPMYNNYSGSFFNSFGAVDWHPNVVINTEGKGQFSFLNYGLATVKLYFEGIVNDKEFVSDIVELKIQ
ncbi:hypothetical protein [Muriicola sp.]|uniref:hypothetical protein n=1 Tax=Muriicola sp. TaxID=2020856 RepID=UPI003C7764F6